MRIEKVFLEKKGFSRMDCEITNSVRNLFEYPTGKKVDPEVIIREDTFFLLLSSIPTDLMPVRTYKNKVKNPKTYQIDILVVFSQGDLISKPIRYKQPDPNGKNFENSNKIEVSAPNIIWTYLPKSKQQLRDWYTPKEKEGISGFKSEDDFISWYQDFVQDKNCAYCGLSERDSQRIVHEGKLTSLRFPVHGLTSQGVNRGYWLEIDRKNPTGLYSRDNCNPSCYFCNNDKSDVFSDKDYRAFYQNRLTFIQNLLQ